MTRDSDIYARFVGIGLFYRKTWERRKEFIRPLQEPDDGYKMFGFKENKEPWRDGVYLTTVDSTMTADILISKLAAEGIPCMKRHEGASNFLELYMGMSTVFPVELYVPGHFLEQAREVIRPVPIEDDFDEISEEELAALAEAGDLEAAEAALRETGSSVQPAADGESDPVSEESSRADEEADDGSAPAEEPAEESRTHEEEDTDHAETPETGVESETMTESPADDEEGGGEAVATPAADEGGGEPVVTPAADEDSEAPADGITGMEEMPAVESLGSDKQPPAAHMNRKGSGYLDDEDRECR